MMCEKQRADNISMKKPQGTQGARGEWKTGNQRKMTAGKITGDLTGRTGKEESRRV